ncbi:MAG: aminotransferase class I/II-fold pyridoxal phosphate-dependent enzyme, partial [Clostridia bacterium]
MSDKFARKGIENLVAYVPGKPMEEVQAEYGLDVVIKMASNENPLGVSPKAVEAIQKEAVNCFMYPEGSSRKLREKIAAGFDIADSQVIVGNGADHILTMLAEAFVNEGDECLMGDPSFAAYNTNTLIMGGTPIKVGLKDMTFDLDAMAAKFSDKTKMIYICNPNNPTGTIVGKEAIAAFLAK